jgi:hypothetical protein
MTAPSLRRPMRYTGAALAAVIFVLAQPAAAADFQIDNLRFEFGKVVIAAPKIMVKGSPLEREAFVSLFNGNTGESAVARMGRLNAAEISAPELRFEHTLGPQKQVTVYRDIRFSDVRDGKIGQGESASATVSVEGAPSGAMKGELKRTSFEALDLKQTARVMTEKAAPGVVEPALPLFGRFEQDGYTLDMGSAGKMSLGKSSGRGFSARVGAEPLGEVLSRVVSLSEQAEQKSGDPDAKRDPAQREIERRVGLSLLALFDTVEYGSGEVRDFVANMVAPAKPGAKPEAIEMRIARIAYGEATPAQSGFSVEGLQFAGSGAKGQIESISHSGFSFGSVIRELQAALAKPDADLDALDFHKFIPTLGTIRMTGLSVDAPPAAGSTQPIKVALGTFELKAGEPLNGIPTSLALTIDKLVAPVTEGAGNPAAADLIAMGIRSLDLSAKLDLAWEAARNELAIRSISLGSAGLIKFDASGTLGNVTKDLFSSDLALAQVAALGATARLVEARLQNFGLIEKLIANEARKAKRKPEEMRQQFAMMANLGLAAILGPSDAAKALTAAVSRFAAKPGILTIQASAKSSSGLGLADVITLGDPTEIFDKIDLKANAE